MRTPQRSFVVEFKSRRRHQNPSATSIWGNADLKAIAREVEEETSHLFGTSERDSDGVEPAIATSNPAGEGPGTVKVAVVSSTSVDGAPSLSAPADLPARAQAAEALAHPVGGPSPKKRRHATTAVKKHKNSKLRPAKIAVRSSALDFRRQEPAPQVLNIEAPSVDDLDVLDAENRRMRALLAERLRRENGQLRTMLTRFDLDSSKDGSTSKTNGWLRWQN
ncbi:hypothetical protein RGCCGE502_33191 (plasmid) [Rhizobium grahamii CCGE 502]|uniref:Uncharacterized protein n=1 Tax=Rhizobium grahamii CCGE 502 TaxID=990285 RepID=S3H672_9HYPH|nr:hypothetical protein RGCCGE502_33191 [Rhizobium grahamii CCGE 502]